MRKRVGSVSNELLRSNNSTSVSPIERGEGQGSLEYLLLAAGAILVAIIVFLLLFTFAPVGGTVLNQDIVEYKKIDLCTSQDATCNFFLNWNEGLLQQPYGFFFENKSDWRTLVVDGLSLKLICGNAICTVDDFPNGAPVAVFLYPIESSSSNCTAGPVPGMYSCPPCDVSSPTSSCKLSQWLPFCDAVTGVCSVSYEDMSLNLNPFPASTPHLGIVLPPTTDPSLLSKQKVAVVGVGPFVGSTKLTGVQFLFRIGELDGGAINYSAFDVKAEDMFWYNSYPYNTGSSYSCDISGSGMTQYGCTFEPDCELHVCGESNPPPGLNAFCIPYFPGATVCKNAAGSFSQANCVNVSTASNPGYFELDTQHGAVVRMDLSTLKNASSYLNSVTNGLNLAVANFDSSVCTDQASCVNACDNLQAQFGGVQLYDIGVPPGGDTQSCNTLKSSFSSPGTLIPHLPPTMKGGIDVEGNPFCFVEYDFPGFLTSKVLSSSDLYLGLRYNGSPSLKVISPYPNGTLNDPSSSPAIRAIFFPK